jgi:flagellar protein FliS
MSSHDPTEAYRRAAIENAPPLKLVQMLYQGCLRFIGEARAAHEGGDLPRFTERLGRAQAIVAELRSSLDPTQAEALCGRLDSLYVFLQSELTEAIIERSTERLPATEGVLRTLLDAWRELNFQAGAA